MTSASSPIGHTPDDADDDSSSSSDRGQQLVGKLRRFAIVGVLATALDVSVLLWMILGRGRTPFYADLFSVFIAGTVSYWLHRAMSNAGSPSRKWFESYAASYMSAMVGSWTADVVVFTTVLDVWNTKALVPVLIAKVVSLSVAVAVRSAAYRSILGQAVRTEQRSITLHEPQPGRPRLSVVVPAYNEADRIGATIEAIRSQLGAVLAPSDIELVVVDDGSSDGTSDAARVAGADMVITVDPNAGKGAAVRAGMQQATGATRAFIDADLAYSPDQLLGLLAEVEAGWDVVVGSRKHTSATTLVRAGRLREMGSRVVNLLTMVALLGRYRDTQCGLKAFHSSAAESIFSVTKIDRFAMDIEVLFLVERNGLSLIEVPVKVSNSERSSVRVVRDTARLLRDVFIIRWNAHQGLYAAPSAAGAAVPSAAGAAVPLAADPAAPPSADSSSLG